MFRHNSCSLIRLPLTVSCFAVYSDKKKSEIILFLLFKVIVNVVLGISKSLANFATLNTISLLNDTTMSCFFHNGLLLLFSTIYALLH